MIRVFVRYHLTGNKVVSEIKEFQSFGEAVARIGTAIRTQGWIGIVKKDGYVTEIRTISITHFDVLTEECQKKESDLNYLSNLAKSALR